MKPKRGAVPDAPYHVYRSERPRPRRWPYIIVAAACVLAAVGAWQLYRVPRVSAVTPGPGAYVKDPSAGLVLEVHGLSALQNVAVTLDGRDVTRIARRDGDTLSIATGALADGRHTARFTATSANVFRRDVSEDWHFTVDTSVPELTFDAGLEQGRITTDPAIFSGTTEPYATVTVVDGDVRAGGQADAAGNYVVKADLRGGESQVLVTTVDRAGNRRAKRLEVYVDAQPPALKVTQLDRTIDKAAVSVRVNATDDLGVPSVALTLDGRERKLIGPASRARFKAAGLAQGRHVLVVVASDKGGNEATDRQVFTVDSTERFGGAAIGPGARGHDVRALQRRLAAAGVYSGRASGYYDGATAKAVRRLEAKYGIEPDGIVGGDVLKMLSGKIIVDLGDLRLYLYRGDRLIKSYRVATGQPAYPTPTGTFSVVEMTEDPTWLPPNSDWAKDAQPIPPGTENPLGTRWMGTSAPGVGIHGVPPSEDGSIGSYASHGCVRMHNWDAVDLFDRIVVGMPVIIRQ
jgi:lipoprotein-anchoring transpeptidase ErfK/SrfK